MDTTEEQCSCIKIVGHQSWWYLWPRIYSPSPGYLSLGDWTTNPYIWLHYVESSDGLLRDDDVLINTDTRFWSIHDVQRYFLGDLHCEQVLYTYQYPNLRLPTRLGMHLWNANTSLKIQGKLYRKEFNISLEITLQNELHKLGSPSGGNNLIEETQQCFITVKYDPKHVCYYVSRKMISKHSQMDRLIISDQLINIDRLDYFKRKTFFRLLLNIMSFQDNLQLVSFENMCCKRLEGVRLIQQLACFNSATLKYLFLWRFVLPNENPTLINYSYITGSGQYIPRPKTKQCFLRSISELKNLRLLALEYSHLADGTGGAILAILPVLKRPHFRLQLICREDQTPGRADAALGVGGYLIPDTAWRRISTACPDLYVSLAFHRIRDYDNVRRFLTPSIPLRETHLEYGIDIKMKQRQDSDVSCFIRHIAYHYASTLVTLSVHQWRFAIFPLRRVFELTPKLTRFFYVGRVADEVDLKRMLYIVSCGVCDNLKQINIKIEDEKSRRDYWQKVVKNLTEQFANIMELYQINFCLSIYKI